MVRPLVTPLAVVFTIVAGLPALAQTPQPFPRPGESQAAPPAPPAAPPPQAAPPPRSTAPAQAPPVQTPAVPPAVPTPVQTPVQTAPPAAAVPAPESADTPTAVTLGVPLYPGAEFLASYDAGRGQRYYIFGTTASYTDLVTFYRTQLRDRGDQVFAQPATHMFSTGRFREDTMAFTPGVTIKDFTSAGSAGYPNPLPGASPARFPTIIMIVPLPPAAAAPAAR